MNSNPKRSYAITFIVHDSMTFDIVAADRNEAATKASELRETLNLDQPVDWELELIQEVLPHSPDFESI